MSGEEHYRQAEAYLRCGDVARAQVHANLAQAAATMEQSAATNWLFDWWMRCSRPWRSWMLISVLLTEFGKERWEWKPIADKDA